MGFSSSKSKTKQTPIVNEPMNTNLIDYSGGVANFFKSDPSQYVAPASPLQQQAFAGAQNLGGWQAPAQQALSMAQGAAGAGPATYQAPQLGQAAQAQAAQLGPAVAAEAAPQAQAQSLLTNLNAYMNPYTDRVVDSTLANYDEYSGQQAAALQARAGATGAFRGSRMGLAEGQFEADRGRQRAATEYGIRADAFNTGATLSGQDADRRQNTNFFNIGNTQQRNLFDAGQRNQFALTQGGFNQQANMFNTGAQNQFALAQGGMDAQAAQYNAAAQEVAYQRALQAAGLTANIGQSMGANARADLGLTADLGAMQYGITQAQLNAPLTQLQAAGQLYGYIPQSSYIGQNTVTKSNPGIGGMLGGLAGSALAGWASGGFSGLGGGGSLFGMNPTGGAIGM